MKDNKKKVILFFAIVVIAIVIVVLVLMFGKNDSVTPSGNVNIVASLNGGSQAEIDKTIKNDLEEKKYGLSGAKVYLNPYGSTPLSALIAFKSDKETDVTVTIKGKNGDDLTLSSEKAIYHYVPIYGLYANYENTVEVKLGTGEKQSFAIKTEGIEGMPKQTVRTANTDGSIYFFTSPIAMTSFGIDGHGEVRWLIDEMYYHNIVELDNGHLLIGTDDINNDGLYTRLIEIDYLGRLYNEYVIEEGYLNDFFVKEDGNIIIASKKAGRKTYSDYIIEIDGKTGKIVKNWDVYKLLEDIDPVFTNGITRSEYFYNSGIEYDEKSDSLLLTYWGGEFVINLSYKDGSVKWIFSNPENFTSAFNGVLLKGAEGFTYPKSMHSAKLDGDTLKVFDNGYSTNKNDANTANLVGSYSSANTYKISGKNISLESSIDEGKKLFSYALADYKVYDKNELVLFGRELAGLDMSKGGNINDYEHLYSRVIEKKDNETVLDMDVDWATHTVDKIKLDKSEFNFNMPDAHTSLEPTKKEAVTNDIIKMIGKAENTVPYEFGYSKGMIEHDVLFMSDDEAKLVLVKENNDGAVYTLKVKGETTSRRIVTDLSKGKYFVYVLENGVMYKTDKFIEID